PLKKKAKNSARSGNLSASALSPSQKYVTETVSDIEAETQQFLNDETVDGASAENAKPKAGLLSEVEPIEGESLDGETQNANSLPKTNGKALSKVNGKTAIDPALDEQTTGALVVRKGQKAAMLRAQPEIAAEAVQSRDLTEEENPFQAVGIRFGSITLRPALEQGLEITSNNSASSGGSAATSSVTTFRFDGISDWRNGALETNGFVTLRQALSGGSDLDPEAGAAFKLTQPILRNWSYTIGGSYGLKRESAVSGSAFPATITQRPLAQDIRLSIATGKSDGVLQPSAKLEFGRLTYGNATDSLGASISQSDRDQTSLRGTIRLGAEVSPAFTPFAEVAYGKTWRDETLDVFGNDRSSTDLRASVGAELNISEKLNGEVSIGWLRQTYDSGGLTDIDGIALAAALNWSPSQGTIVSAGLTTNAEPANSATVSGSLLYGATLGITHQLSSRLSTSANFGLSYRDFTDAGGNDTTLSAELAATYMVNRMLGVNAKARYETVSSSDPTRKSDTTTLLLGLKIQR
ncbi:MAG: outer membrane beta-barrel protein, partial [Notoacmeibacter sp.]